MPEITNCRAGVALVIGVGDYLRPERVEPLRFAKLDADALAATLADPHLCAFPQSDVVLLTNEEARRDDVVQRLSRWLPERASGTDLVVIYFAGHGMVQTVGRREEGFLLPYDADPDDVVTRGIAMSDLGRWIDGLQTRAVVVCLDCCHAGKMLGQRDVGPARNMELKPAVLQNISGKGRYLIASCDDGEKSFESADLGHGLFTFHLLQGIAGAADSDGDGRVGLAELFNYVSRAVSLDARQKFGRDQKPWTSATWTDETYISSPKIQTTLLPADPIERLWREQGANAAIAETQRLLADADADGLRRALRFLGRVKEKASVPVIFRCLTHVSDAVRTEARNALHAFDWDTVGILVKILARRGDAAEITPILDGLNAFETHAQVVSLLDRLIVLLKGDLRNRAILIRERKQLGLGLDEMAALFREIHSPYRLEKVLGQGLFTQTYLARDEATGLEVVVRVLRPELVNQAEVRARFLDVSNQSVHLIHEKLALTREARAFPEKHIYFTVRDYIPGVTLQRVLEAGKRFEPLQVVRILRDTAEALAPLHRKNLCHGGIKPSNIFLCEGDRVVLGDPTLPVQGIGLALDRLAYDYRYAPPEMFQSGGVVGPASDFYALGCVAYELTCGQPPFVSDNFHELASLHVNKAIVPPAPSALSAGLQKLAGNWDAVLLKLLARSPAERYGSLAEVLQTFASWETALAPRPLLRDASLAGYQEALSVVNFERPNAVVDDFDGGVAPSASGEKSKGSGEKSKVMIPGYEILQVIGRGGLGVVYKAEHQAQKRLVALKVIRSTFDQDGDLRQREMQGAKALGRLPHHPNIASILDVFDRRDGLYFAMEFVEGGDLAHKLVQGPFPTRAAVELAAKLARAVQFAHEHRLLHRDLKPSNILLTKDGEPKITDFGLAKYHEDQIAEAAVSATGPLGTPRYMAPEQFRGAAGPGSDIYALGMIFFELLTGSRPFAEAAGMAEMMYQTISEIPARPTDVRKDVPEELAAVCLKCLEKDPAQRYLSAQALAEDLERWLRGEPVSVQPAKPSMSMARAPQTLWQRLLRLFSSRE